MLKRVISGGQSGSDLAGLIAAKKFGLETGGTMPFGFKCMDGSGRTVTRPEYKELYGMVAHTSTSYVPRTRKNVKDSDGTIRLAFDFDSRGELCTMKAIKHFKKPYIDVDLSNPIPVDDVVKWLKDNDIETLNVAGNAEETYSGIGQIVIEYLEFLFGRLQSEN